jgi:hypothetical protein
MTTFLKLLVLGCLSDVRRADAKVGKFYVRKRNEDLRVAYGETVECKLAPIMSYFEVEDVTVLLTAPGTRVCFGV